MAANSAVHGPIRLNFELSPVSSKLSCMFLSSTRMNMIQLEMKWLECSQHFSRYKSMEIVPDAQGLLTLSSLFRSGRISNSF